MAFHRLTVPVYAGGLRVGDDYLNNQLTGTPAQVKALRTEGPNAGSYFVNFGEHALSAAVNRALYAFGQNTDFLDDEIIELRVDMVAADAGLAALIADLTAQLTAVRTITGAATLHSPSSDGTIIINPAANFNLTLPNPNTCTGKKVFLVNGTGTMAPSNKCTLARGGSELINNLAQNYVLDVPYGRWWLMSDGTNWHIGFMSP